MVFAQISDIEAEVLGIISLADLYLKAGNAPAPDSPKLLMQRVGGGQWYVELTYGHGRCHCSNESLAMALADVKTQLHQRIRQEAVDVERRQAGLETVMQFVSFRDAVPADKVNATDLAKERA